VSSKSTQSDNRDDGDSFSVEAWCKHRGLSRSMFYLLDKQGKAPRTYSVGKLRFITAESDLAWLRDREAEANIAAA
jgi:hypothetical protein